MKKFSDYITSNPYKIIVLFALISIGLGAFLPMAQVDPDVQNMLPENMESRVALKKIETFFGGTKMAMLLFTSDTLLSEKSMSRIASIAEKVKTVKGVQQVNSITGFPGFMDSLKTKTSEELKSKLKSLDMVYGRMISKDFRTASIIISLDSAAPEYEMTKKLREIVAGLPGDEDVVFGGMPFVNEIIQDDIPKDMALFMPAGIILMILFLFFCFREAKGVVMPLVVVVMSILVGMGLIPILGWKIQMVTILLPVILIAIANNYGIHIVSRYQLEKKENSLRTNREIASKVVSELTAPVLATGLTTVAGLLCLVTHIIIPAGQLGILSSIGVVFALFASLLFVPALLVITDKNKDKTSESVNSELSIADKFIEKAAVVITKNSGKILLLVVAFTVVAAIGIKYIRVDSNPVNFYGPDSDIVKMSKLINSEFGGAQVISIIAEGDLNNPEVLQKIDNLESRISELKNVGNTMSIARVLKSISVVGGGKSELPKTYGRLQQYYSGIMMNDPASVSSLMTFDRKKAQIMVQITSESNSAIKSVKKEIDALIAGDTLFPFSGGSASIFTELIDKVVSGQVFTLIASLFIITFLVMIFFKSFVAGLISFIPLAIALIFLFGFMGYSGVTLDISTAMLSSIMIGVGVDYTIHFLWKYRDERSKGNSSENAVTASLKMVGRGIVFNALSVVIGFSVLILSSFEPIKFFGYLIALSISTCMIGALVILPAICVKFNLKLYRER